MRPKLSPGPRPPARAPADSAHDCRCESVDAEPGPGWALVGTHPDLPGGSRPGPWSIADSERMADCGPSLIAPNVEYECDRSAGMRWQHPPRRPRSAGSRRCRPRRQRLPQSPMSWLTNAAPGPELLRALRGRVRRSACSLPCRRKSVARRQCVVRQHNPNGDSTRRAWSSARPRARTRQGPC